MADALWRPSPQRIANANLTRFRADAVQRFGAPADDYARFHAWSVEQRERFWEALWEFADIRASRRGSRILENRDAMPGARWFDGARLNFAENLLRYDDTHTALVFRGEGGARETLSYAELRERVAATAAGLRAAGVEPGDRVAGMLPNRPEAVIAMLASASLGAIWSSCSPDFGANAVLDRFGQIRPKVLFAVDGYRYNGRGIDTLARVAKVSAGLGNKTRVVIVPFLNPEPDLSALKGATFFEDFLEPTSELDFAQLAFDHPLYILYSSGTTGAPKCIVHGAGGTLLQHTKELALHTDLKREDTIFYFTTCGWMMWNWLVSSLAGGATVVLFDGAPMHPGPETLWRMAEEEGITIFGTSAKYISALEKTGLRPRELFTLEPLRALLSTGSPLAPEHFDYVYSTVKDDLQLASISGGTDIVSCFALGNPILPVYRGELQCRGLGMAVEIFDEHGHPVRGEKGELVCTAPFPSMPVCFWNDEDGARYHNAYFERFPGIWHHGDYAELTPRGGLIIHGRSDAILNPGGVRIGTAEIYRQVEKLEPVLESVAVGQEWDDDVRVILFVRLRESVQLDDPLRDRIRRTIRENASPRHVPAKILAVADIPRTISGKITEVAVREVIHGRPVKNSDALANPDALELYRDLPELREA